MYALIGDGLGLGDDDYSRASVWILTNTGCTPGDPEMSLPSKTT